VAAALQRLGEERLPAGQGRHRGAQGAVSGLRVRRVIGGDASLQIGQAGGGPVVNGSSNYRLDHGPFGGVKESGYGRESPRHRVEDCTVVKTLMLRGLSIWGED